GGRMSGYTSEGLLLNIFFIMFPLIFYHIILKELLEKYPVLKSFLFYFLFTTSSLLCMYKPIFVQPGLVYDFRIIPLILAGFYSNRSVFLSLCCTLIVTRYIIGGVGFNLTIISSLCTLIFVFSFEKRYRLISLTQKMISVGFISFISK